MTDAPENGHADAAEGNPQGEAARRTLSGSAASNLPSTLATFVAGNRRRTAKGEATVTKVRECFLFPVCTVVSCGLSTLTEHQSMHVPRFQQWLLQVE